jgi:hypothetical protein
MDDRPELVEEELFSLAGEPRRRIDLLLIVGVIILIGFALWMLVGPTSDPCRGAPPGTVVEDPDNQGDALVCKG